MPASPSVRERVIAFLGLGANLGDALGHLREAVSCLRALPKSRLLACSSVYRSAPVDAAGPDYLNAVLGLETGLCAPELWREMAGIEMAAGRERPYRNAPRTLDLDLLLYGHGCIQSSALSVPHPRMTQRAFVLQPLFELAPERVEAQALSATAGQRIERVPGLSLVASS